MIEPTVLLDPTRSVEETHLDLIANGTVAVVSAADFPPGKYPTDIVGRLIDDHQEHCDICGTLEYPRTIPDKRQKANDVSGIPAGLKHGSASRWTGFSQRISNCATTTRAARVAFPHRSPIAASFGGASVSPTSDNSR